VQAKGEGGTDGIGTLLPTGLRDLGELIYEEEIEKTLRRRKRGEEKPFSDV